MGAQPAGEEPRWKVAGPPYRLTRAELLRELHDKGYEITERQVRRWGELGLLPPPVRQMPPGATDGRARALYPGWTLALIVQLLADVAQGARIADLRAAAPGYRARLQATASDDTPPTIPSRIFRLSGAGQAAPATGTGAGLTTGGAPRLVTAAATLAAEGSLAATGSVIPRVPRALQRALWKYVAGFAERNATAVDDATLTLRDEAGRPLVTIPIAPPPAPRRKARHAGGEQRPEFTKEN